jgi:hypothetical protein
MVVSNELQNRKGIVVLFALGEWEKPQKISGIIGSWKSNNGIPPYKKVEF